MKYIFFIAMLFAFSSTTVNAADFEDYCEKSLPVAVNDVGTMPVTVDPDIRQRSVDSMTKRLSVGIRKGMNFATLGVTSTLPGGTVEPLISFLSDKSTGRICYRVSSKVIFKFEPMVISMPHSLNPGTCSYEMVLAHEHKHVDIYSQYLPVIRSAIVDSINSRFGQKVFYASSPDAADEFAYKELQVVFNATVRREMIKLLDLNMGFDVQESAKVVSGACDDEIKKTLKESGYVPVS